MEDLLEMSARLFIASMVSILCGSLLSLRADAPPSAAKDDPVQPDPASLEIKGYGLFGNRILKRTLRLLDDRKEPPEFYSANFTEDAALILLSHVRRDGYLASSLDAELTLADGTVRTFSWRAIVQEPLPRPLQVKNLKFIIEKGPLFYFEHIEFHGLESLGERQGRHFFVETDALLPLKRHRVFTPQRLDQGIQSLKTSLQRRGYESASVIATNVVQDRGTGAVRAAIVVVEGKKSIVRTLRTEIYFDGSEQPDRVETNQPNAAFSEFWLQDVAQNIRSNYFQLGYPDTAVEVSQARRIEHDRSVDLHLHTRVRTGPLISLGTVKFVGAQKSKPSLLNRQVDLDPGKPLNRIAAERGRYELARLGVFESVELEYEPAGDATRDIVYTLDEGKTVDLSLLFGYGSYELVRGGIELEQFNLWGRAHHSRLRLVQSIKSSSANYNYTMPEFFGEDVDLFIHLSGLRREEVSFTRQELVSGIGARTFLDPLASDLSVRYNYQYLRAAESDIALEEGRRTAGVGSFIFDLSHDRRDNPLYPRNGFRLFSLLEVATEYLAGEVNYQRFEFGGAYHHPFPGGRWIHFGLSHGVIFTLDGPAVDLPFNKRFFPGGENSVRGYQQGEAAPLNAEGKSIGAETYLLANLELEQALTPAWSLVGFVDAIGVGRRVGDYPFDQTLVSVGGGIRWKTLIGPVRLEYGHNLNRREHDPGGTLHFSIGFPF